MGCIMAEAPNRDIYSHRLIYRVLILHLHVFSKCFDQAVCYLTRLPYATNLDFFRMLLYKQDTVSTVFLPMDHLCVHVLSKLLLGN